MKRIVKYAHDMARSYFSHAHSSAIFRSRRCARLGDGNHDDGHFSGGDTRGFPQRHCNCGAAGDFECAGRELGGALVEFLLVSVLLIFLLLAVLQVAIFVHERNVVTASAAEGARYASNADVANPAAGARKASALIATTLSHSVKDRLRCRGRTESGPEGVRIVRVRCSGRIPTLLRPLGAWLPVDVSGRAPLEKP